MNFHLDTNIVIGLLNGWPPHYRARYETIRAANNVSISSVVVFELWYGLAHSGRAAENAETLRRFLGTLSDILPFTDEDAVVAGEIRAHLRKTGKPVGPYDLLIAAQAVRSGATLATANLREFARIDGLVCENWAE